MKSMLPLIVWILATLFSFASISGALQAFSERSYLKGLSLFLIGGFIGWICLTQLFDFF